MGREVRRVPPHWEHPDRPLLDGFNEEARAYYQGELKWGEGLWENLDGAWVPIPPEQRQTSWREWSGDPPNPADYMPDWPEEERTHWQMYETTTEGMPISPVCETPEELAQWLADNEASVFASFTATYAQWLAMIRRTSAPSFMLVGNVVVPGVIAVGEWDEKE